MRVGSLPSRLAALLLLICAVLLVGLLVVRPYLHAFQGYRSLAIETQAQMDRFAAHAKDPKQIRAELDRMRKAKGSRGLFLKAKSESRAGALLLQRLTDAVQREGGTLVSSQVVPGNGKSPFPMVTVRAQLKVTAEALQHIFHRFESQRPALFIDNLLITARKAKSRRVRRASRRASRRGKVIRPVARQEETPPLRVRFDLTGYLWQEGA